MAATDTSKTPQRAKSQNTMNVKGENDHVSLEQALEALKQAQALLDAYRDTNAEWQDPVILLNKTAEALDEAALATRNDGETAAQCGQQQVMLAVQELSSQLINDRQAILDATQQVVSGTRPAKLWNPNTLIVYATHTGTSRDYAHQLQKNLGSEAEVMNIKHVSLLDLQERKRVFFICSTFGIGRPPRDAEVVYMTLQILETQELVAEPEKEALVGLEFAVAALGNSKFEAFCKFGRELRDRLSALGGEEILPVTFLDANNGKAEQEAQFREWQEQVLDIEGVAPREGPNDIPEDGITDNDIKDTRQRSSVESTCCTIL